MFPTGEGIGATQDGWLVISPTRAAGSLPTITVADALVIIPGPAGTHGINVQGRVISVVRACGIFPTSTFGWPLMMFSGSAGWGTGVGVGAGGWIGA